MTPQLEHADDTLLAVRAVLNRYRIVSMTLYRWLDKPALNFPRPVYIGRFRYWRLSDLIAWEAGRPRTGVKFGAAKARAESDREVA